MKGFKFFFNYVFSSFKSRTHEVVSRILENPSGELQEVAVQYVHDGDSVDVHLNGEKHPVRLTGIDCPEGNQPWGEIATAGLVKLIGGRRIYLEVNGWDSKWDRILATVYVMVDKELINVNERMVMLGHAWATAHIFRIELSEGRCRQLVRLEKWARAKRVGLWQTANPIPPWKWRRNESA